MITKAFITFYDKPRNRFLCFLGAFFVAPMIKGLEKDIARQETIMKEMTMDLGRLKLTQRLLVRWWK